MVDLDDLPVIQAQKVKGYRLVNSKFPPISLFDDVVSPEEFEVMYKLETMVNPRLKAETGNLSLLPKTEIPFGIPGCSYATAPFTHINKDGSRFSDGTYGVLYLADSMQTALKEVEHHQQVYWKNVPDLDFEVFVFRGLLAIFSANSLLDATSIPLTEGIYDPDDYTDGRTLGLRIKANDYEGIQYCSVRKSDAKCWGLFTPRGVKSIIQSAHYEMVWSENTLTTRQLQEP